MKGDGIVYQLLEERLVSHEDNITYNTYGVLCTDHGYAVSDVTLDKVKMTDFVRLLNDAECQFVHLMDVIEDFIAELQ